MPRVEYMGYGGWVVVEFDEWPKFTGCAGGLVLPPPQVAVVVWFNIISPSFSDFILSKCVWVLFSMYWSKNSSHSIFLSRKSSLSLYKSNDNFFYKLWYIAWWTNSYHLNISHSNVELPHRNIPVIHTLTSVASSLSAALVCSNIWARSRDWVCDVDAGESRL